MAVATLVSVTCSGQANIAYGSLEGTVTDASKALLPGTEITATSQGTGDSIQFRTDGRGSYRLAYLKPGHYLVRAHHEGFSDATSTLDMTVGTQQTINFSLGVAGAAEHMEVTSGALNSGTQVASVVRTQEIDNLPLISRDYLNLTLLLPDVSRSNVVGQTSRYQTTSAVPDAAVSISGQRPLSNSYIVDGLYNNDDAANLPGTYYTQEVFREFQVVTSNATAEFGRAESGFVNLATRSGTNDFHGRMYGFLRNQWMDAKNALTHAKTPLTWPQYGVTLGGPLRRDRTFFFINYERTRNTGANIVTVSPANVAAINAVLTAKSYPGLLLSTGTFPASIKTDNLFLRLDHQLSSRDQIYARYNLYKLAENLPVSTGTTLDVSRDQQLFTMDQVVSINNVYSFSPRTFNETRAQFFRYPLRAPGVSSNAPGVTISGVVFFGPASTFPTARDTNGSELADAVTLLRAQHSFKIGVDAIYQRIVITQPGNQWGSYTFSSIANLQAGRYSTFTQDFGDPLQGQVSTSIGAFAQDEWRIRSNFTANLGVRYDVQSTPTQLTAIDTNNVAPRIGFVWSPYNDRRTVIRASYGIYYNRIPARIMALALQRTGGAFKTATLSYGQTGAPSFPNPIPAFLSSTKISYQTMAANFPVDSSTQVSAELEQELSGGITVKLGYDHLRGLHLPILHGINVPTCTSAVDPVNLCRPNPNFGNIDQYAALGDSWFDGMSTSLLLRPQPWVSGRISYTWSHAIDDTANAFTSSPFIQNNVLADRGRSDNDQRHRMVASAVLASPTRKSHDLWTALAYGFQLSGIMAYDSALPLNVLAGADVNGDSYTSSDRPAGAGRNVAKGFNSRNLDARLSRTFAFGDRWKLEGVAESFNVLNTTNWQAPNQTWGTGAYPNGTHNTTFGTPTAVADPRQIQLGARLSF
jgi:hypothetical protein